MAETISIIIDARDDTRSAISSVQSGFNGLAGAASSAVGPFGRIAEIAGGIITAQLFQRVAEGLVNIGRAAFNATADYERLGLTLNTLLARELVNTGAMNDMATALTAAKAPTQELLTWTTQLAILSPFTEEDIAYVLRISMAYGMSSPMAKGLAQALADLGAATGFSGSQMQLLALAFGQVQAKGYLTGEEMRQLTNAGIGVDLVAKAMKISVSDVAAAIEGKKIKAQELLPALIDIIQSDFGGSAARMALSWAGLSSTIGDLAKITLRTLFTPALEAARPLVISFVDTLQQPSFRTALSEIGVQLGQTIAEALRTLTGLVKWAKEHWDALKGALLGVGIAFGALIVIAAVTLLVAALASPVVLITGLAILLGVAWATNWGGIQDKTKSVIGFLSPFLHWFTADAVSFFTTQWNTVKAWVDVNWPLIRQVIEVALKAIRAIWEFFWPYLHLILTTVWDNMKLLVGGALDTILGIFRADLLALTGDWEGAWKELQHVADVQLTAIWGVARNTFKLLLNLFNTSWQNILSGAKDAWFWITDAIWRGADNMWKAVSEGPFAAFLGKAMKLWAALRAGFANMFSGLHLVMPHINVQWQNLPVLGRIPSGVNVDWYAGGLDAIFNRPTLIGVGEAGAERVQVTPLGGGGGGTTWNLNVTYANRESEGSLADMIQMLQMRTA